MKDFNRFQVSPNPAPLNASIMVLFPVIPVIAESYQITDDDGHLIRRGKITDRDRDLLLSTGGMSDGVYWLIVGESRERFIIS